MPGNFCRYCRLCLSVASLLVAVLTCGTSPAQTSRVSQTSVSPITVVIDAGHGGDDPGGIPSQRVAYKNMTLDVAHRGRNDPTADGCRVGIITDSDGFG